MYSFVLHAHQKIDRVAYKHLSEITNIAPYLKLKDILHFEGPRGPDATRLKRGSNQPPWHFYNPDAENERFFNVVLEHYRSLVKELRSEDKAHAAFEAAWLAHALVDGLTPAHHYPYEEELAELRNDKDKNTRETVRSHFIVRGQTYRETVKRSMQLIGPKGLLTTHTTFEAGAAMIILPLVLSGARIDTEDLAGFNSYDKVVKAFKRYVAEVDSLQMYERFYRKGWTPKLAREVRSSLAPCMVNMVTLAWYAAASEAGIVKEKQQ